MTGDDIVLEFVPAVSVGDLVFGMGVDQAIAAARRVFGAPTVQEADSARFHDNSVLLEFDRGVLVFVEVGTGAGVDVRLNGVLLGDLTDAGVREVLGEPDTTDDEYPWTFAYPQRSLVFWRPASPDDVRASRAADDDEDDEYWAAELARAARFSTIAMAVPGYWD